jgi:type 1 glutamine amidotransferase
MRRAVLIVGVIAAVLAAFGAPLPVGAEDAAKIKTLLITGDDVKPHPWKETSAASKDILAASGKFEVTVVEDLAILEKKDDLGKFDLIVYMRYNTKKEAGEPTDAGKANLLDFVKGGKGFVVCHLSSASFNGWEEWNKLCGRHWIMGKSGHGPRSVFKSKIADKADSITKGAEDFEIDDELYAKLAGEEKIHVLVEADSDWSKKTEPLMFTLPYGQGRVFHDAYGHDGKAVNTPAHAKLFARGCEWAAKGKVSE